MLKIGWWVREGSCSQVRHSQPGKQTGLSGGTDNSTRSIRKRRHSQYCFVSSVRGRGNVLSGGQVGIAQVLVSPHCSPQRAPWTPALFQWGRQLSLSEHYRTAWLLCQEENKAGRVAGRMTSGWDLRKMNLHSTHLGTSFLLSSQTQVKLVMPRRVQTETWFPKNVYWFGGTGNSFLFFFFFCKCFF